MPPSPQRLSLGVGAYCVNCFVEWNHCLPGLLNIPVETEFGWSSAVQICELIVFIKPDVPPAIMILSWAGINDRPKSMELDDVGCGWRAQGLSA